VWFALLGPVLVHDGQTQVEVPKGRLRALLAALVLRSGTTVSAGALAEAVWDGAPPPSAESTLRWHVLRLRRALGPIAGARLVTRYPGYLLQADDDEIDVLRLRSLCRDGNTALQQGDWARAHELLGQALALWRGVPLADIPCESLCRDYAPGLEELRLQAEEWRADAALQLGWHAELVPGLRSLVASCPLREPFHTQLMLALYRSGRQADALAAYQHARDVLVAELGIEPGPGLRKLQQQILSGAPALAGTSPAPPDESGPQRPIPRELPSAVPGFTGRAAEMQALTRLLEPPAGQAPGAVVITAIGGTAGVGKTALAVQWAHQAADRFPDGQLYVNLRGYDPDRPTPPADALAGFLRSLGVPGQDIPAEEDERAARYRSLLATRKMLIVLDNAGSVEQARLLLPGSATCAVVVTSRDALTGLVARDGATRLELDLLQPAEAICLLNELIGSRAEADSGSTAELAAQCCRLPLALRVAAELAAVRPHVPLSTLVSELTDQQRRLDLLDAGGDPRTAVRAVFSWSYRNLEDDSARAFRLAGLHPGPGFDTCAAAVLTGMSLQQADAVLHVLASTHLIHRSGPDRYGMHDLLRSYARELAAGNGGEEQRAALTRLFDHYLHTSSMAMDTLYPAERHRRPRIPAPSTPTPPVAGANAARAWLDTERPALVAVTVHAAGHGWPAHAIRLSTTLFRYLDSCGHYAEAMTIHSHARAAAQHIGDRSAEADALNHLASVHRGQSRYQEAADYLRPALSLFESAGDRSGQARALGNLGIIHNHLGRYREAIGFCRGALAIYRETGNRVGMANTLTNLGVNEERQGQYDLAARHHRQALAIAADVGARDLECTTLANLGGVGLRLGQYQEAADHLRHALDLSHETGCLGGQAEALARTGDLCMLQGHPDEAIRNLRQALDLHRESRNPSGEADALNSLGEVLLGTGRPDHAHTEYAAALTLAAHTGEKYQQARAHHGLGQASSADGNPGQARRHWEQALTLFTELGSPEAGLLRAQLADARLGDR
jgi:DNA-binding SARP family transcriptional activator/tetratricopeptide (TPR) repeat protein